MKTASLTYPTHRFIDTAPLVVRFDILTKALLVLIETGRGREMLRYSQKVLRLIRLFNRLDRHNHLLARKLDMLTHKPWRECVLRELGGIRKLKLWAAAKARIEACKNMPRRANQPSGPAWLYTSQRLAESERLKAWARDCAKASVHPLIFRDRFKMDFEGEFRLAPLPRGQRAARQITVYTAASISDYTFNAIPFGKEQGFGPAIVWPAEFYAAAKMEAQILEGRTEASAALSHSRTRGSNIECSSVALDPCSSRFFETTGEGDKNKDKGEAEVSHSYMALAPLSLQAVLPLKTYRDLF